ncbi:hypothetical protein HY383_02980 [Candidatus Daviesbacteria bacterium]|nr:hypothetical protein [Candidatus Daviesbacteria bacterium]
MWWDTNEAQKAYPVLVLDHTVIFPGEKIPLVLEDPEMIKVVNFALEKNLVDVPKEIQRELKFKFAEHADKVLDYTLV